MAKNEVPRPVVVRVICSLCDEPWEAHGPSPSTMDCIRLLKARPYWHPYVWSTTSTRPTITSGTFTTNTASINTTYRTPEVA